MKTLLTPPVQRILTALDNNACLVGGCVRDTLLGRPVNDIDIATPLLPETVVARLQAADITVIPTGLQHGTVTAVIDKTPYEITTLRRDVQTDGRHATVAFTNAYAEDANRRDFTINALYLTPSGQVTDPTNGRKDLAQKRLCFIGDPTKRIREDYLRLLRFFRFLAQLPDFCPDSASLAACYREAAGLNHVSAERKRDELFKILTAPRATLAVTLLYQGGILPFLLPTYRADKFIDFVNRAPQADLLERLAVLTDGHIPETFPLSRAQKSMLKTLCHRPVLGQKTSDDQYILNDVGPKIFAFYITRAQMDNRLTQPQATQLLQMVYNPCPITGQDLIDTGFEPGLSLGNLLIQARHLWAAESNPQKKLVIQKLWSYNVDKGDTK